MRDVRLGSRQERQQLSQARARLRRGDRTLGGPVVTLPSKHPDELRHLAIGLIEGKHWTVVYAPREDTFRLISARRSRTNEKKLFQSLVQGDHHGRQS